MVTIGCENLSVHLGGRRVLDTIALELEAGSLIGVIGPNGAGKSTLARAVTGLLPAAAGRVSIDGVDIASLRSAELARRVAYLPQGQELHWPLSVERLVGLGRIPHLAPFSSIREGDKAAIDAALAETGTTGLRDRVATELSGGERARVMLARALATGAPALIADEPLASLDPGHQIDVMTLLRQRARNGSLVVVVLHDLSIAARFCDRLIVVDQGRVEADGDAGTVLTDALLSRVYGITAWRGVVAGRALLIPVAKVD